MPDEQTAILVVDDDPLIRSMCKKVVEAHGFSTILAENGAEALNIFRENHEGIALVVSDISMPVMNGIDMAQQMFAMKPHANLILMTGYTAQVLLGKLKDLCALLYKPFTPRQLIEVIQKCLKYQEARRTAGQ
jgi:two-component system, cell cycle sensor histidine kinase and response regulator CckA